MFRSYQAYCIPLNVDLVPLNSRYLRLKNLQIGYNFQPRLGNNQKLGIYLYASAQNLLTITNYSGYDPEYSGYVDRGTYPASRTFTFGIKLSY